MFVRIASASERIFSASTQRSRRPAAGLSMLCLTLVAVVILPALAITPCDAQSLRAQHATIPRGHAPASPQTALVEKAAATPTGDQHLDFGLVKAGETSPERETTFTFNRTATLGKIEVVTMGAANRDFKATGTGTCEVNRTYSAGDTCTVGVRFAPQFAGERKGAVVLKDAAGTILGVHPLLDTASGGQVIFPPGTGAPTTTSVSVNTGAYSGAPGINLPPKISNASDALALWNEPEGAAVDGSGNIWVTDAVWGGLYKIPYSSGSYGTPVVVDSALCNPWGVAVDGSGNVYVADSAFDGANYDNNPCTENIVEYVGGVLSGKKTIGNTGDFTSPNELFVDGSGNVYVADFGGGVFKISGSTTTQLGAGNANTGTGANAYAVAVDSSGNVYVSIFDGGVYKLAAGTYSESLVSSAFVDPTGLAFDPAGDLYVSDDDNGNGQGYIYKLTPAGGGSFNAPAKFISSLNENGTTVALAPESVVLDESGNLVIENSEGQSTSDIGVYKIDLSTPPSLSFGSVNVGSTSAAQTVTVDNIGNAALTFYSLGSSENPTLPSGYIFGAGNTCPEVAESGANGSLASGASCTLSISLKPTNNGPYTGSAVLTDSDDGQVDATQSIPLTGSGTGGVAPAFTSAASTSFTLGTAGTFSVTTTGTPKPALSESGALPGGVTFTDNGNGTATLAGTPTATGTFNITITAASGVAPNATQSFTLTVSGIAPTISSGASTTFTVGSAGSFSVTTTGTPKPALTESGPLPGGVTFVDNGNGTATIAGTPTVSGPFLITITASNGVSPNATQSFTLTVDQAPAFTSSTSTTFTVGTAGTFTATATGYPAPTFSETGILPSGVTFTSGGLLSGTPTAGTGGTYPLTITASNGVGSNATQSFTLTVNAAPSITSASDTTFTVGTAGSFTTTAAGYPAPTFSVTVGTLPSGVALGISGVISGTPAAGTGGVYVFTITATNGVGSAATQTFTLFVNQAPAIISSSSITFTVGTAGTFTATATGYPAPTFSETGVLPGGVTFTSAGVLSGTPTASGSFPITITASNGVSPNATQNFTLTVAQVPQTITFASPVVEPIYAGGGTSLSATTTSGLPVGFLSRTTSVCSVSGSVGGSWSVSFIAIGECSVESYQWGNSTYAIAPQVIQNFFVHGLAQSITMTPIIGTITSGDTVGISASASSSLPVTFTSKTPATCAIVNVVGWQLVAGSKGTCTIVATQAGNTTYTAAALVITTLTIHGQAQTITFPAIVEPVTAGSSVTLSATASSTLPVTYVATHPAFCTVSESAAGVWSVNLLTAGTCSVIAEQAGNSTYASAISVDQNFYVHPTP